MTGATVAAATDFLTVADISNRTGLSKKAIYRAVHDGELKAAKLRSRLLIRQADFDSWFDDNIVEHSPRPAVVRSRPRAASSHGGLRRLVNAADGTVGAR